MFDWSTLWIPTMAVFRGIGGWFENATRDNKITWPEWQKLIETIVRIGVPAYALVLGFQIDEMQAAGIAVFVDIVLVKIYNAIKKKN